MSPRPATKTAPSIQRLPPITIDLVLPPSYPLHSIPTFLSVTSSHSWICPPLLSTLTNQLNDIALECMTNQEGSLCRMIEFIREGELLDFLKLKVASPPKTLSIPHPTPFLLSAQLATYDQQAASLQFSQESFDCPICLSKLKGARCIRLLKCGHVSCRDCLKEFWALAIREGEVEKVACVDEECVKDRALKEKQRSWNKQQILLSEPGVGEEEIRSVVGDPLLDRWKKMRVQKALEKGTANFPSPSVFLTPFL